MAELRKMLVDTGPASLNQMMGKIQGMMKDLRGLNQVLTKGFEVMAETHGTHFRVVNEGQGDAMSLGNIIRDIGDLKHIEATE